MVLATLGKRERDAGPPLAESEKPIVRRQAARVVALSALIAFVAGVSFYFAP